MKKKPNIVGILFKKYIVGKDIKKAVNFKTFYCQHNAKKIRQSKLNLCKSSNILIKYLYN